VNFLSSGVVLMAVMGSIKKLMTTPQI